MKAEREPLMYFHWQNLNDKPAGRQGSPLRHGRAWMRLGSVCDRGLGVDWEWGFVRHQCVGVGFRATQSEEIGFSFSIGVPFLFSLYVTIYGGLFTALARWVLKFSKASFDDRELSLRFHDAALWWVVWRDGSSWSSTVPRWREGNFRFDDFFLGKAKFSQRVLTAQDVIIPLDGKGYPATVKLEERSWSRPRWFTKRWVGADIGIPGGIGFPGKGENSWDCGDDAIFGMSCNAATIEDAIAEVVRSVLRNRRRYGGSVGWKPEQTSA